MSVPEIWLSTLSRGMEAALGREQHLNLGVETHFVLGSVTLALLRDTGFCSMTVHPALHHLHYTPQLRPSAPLFPNPTAAAFPPRAATFIAAKEEHHVSDTALTLPREILSHPGDEMCLPPPSRASGQGCLPGSQASSRNQQNQKALPVAKYGLPSGKL